MIPTLGHHALLELFGCDPQASDSVATVREALHAAARAMNTPVLGEAYHRFAPQGVSGVILIAESHVSCHSWPEAGYIALDIYTCGTVHPRLALATLREAFAARSWLLQDTVRGLVDYAPEHPVEREQLLVDPRSLGRRTASKSSLQRAHVLRVLGVVRVTDLVEAGDVRELHGSPSLARELSAIALEALRPEGQPSVTESRGESGWSQGGPPFRLLKVVDPEEGALLQCVPAHPPEEDLPLVGRSITTSHLEAGQLYLLRSSAFLHRIQAIGEQPCTILEMGYVPA